MLDHAIVVALQMAEAAGAAAAGGMSFSVSVGDLLSIATTIVAVVSAYSRLSERLSVVETKLQPLWEDYVRRIHQTRE